MENWILIILGTVSTDAEPDYTLNQSKPENSTSANLLPGGENWVTYFATVIIETFFCEKSMGTRRRWGE